MKKIHYAAELDDISKYVLMPGDPLRAKTYAETFLDKARLVSKVRNMFVYSGYYKNQFVTITGSGMGCPSIGIYSHELYANYNVSAIIRVGTAGGYDPNVKVGSLINVTSSYSDSTYAKFAANYDAKIIDASATIVTAIAETAKKHQIPIVKARVHTQDVFYQYDPHHWKKVVQEQKTIACEMETFALFTNARHHQKMAGAILTISDTFSSDKVYMSWEERQNKTTTMGQLALDSLLTLN